MTQAIRVIVQTVDVPVTADIEGGYGSGSAHDVAETVRAVIDVGAVGVNLEDSPGVTGSRCLRPRFMPSAFVQHGQPRWRQAAIW